MNTHSFLKFAGRVETEFDHTQFTLSPRNATMSHLIFDTRDWKFILNEQLNVSQMTSWPKFADYDVDIFEQVVDEGVKFAIEKVAPINEVSDREGCKVVDGSVIVPKEFKSVYKQHTQAGWLGLIHSPEYGGQGLPLTISAPITESTSAAAMAFSMYGGLTHAAGHLVEAFGDEKSKNLFVEKMYSGEWGGTMCLTESNAGSEVGDLNSKAIPQDDGTYLIEGQKIFISGGDHDMVDNIVHLVLARVEGDPVGTKGISLFIVPKYWVGDDGSIGERNNVNVVGIEHKMGINGSATCQLAFGDSGPCRGYLVGEERSGIIYMFQMMNEARIACGGQGVGQANAAYQQALQYAKDRVQGSSLVNEGRASTQIINHPDVRRNLMLMRSHSEGMRAMLAQASYWHDAAQYHPDDQQRGTAQDLLDLVTPVVKGWCTDKAFTVCELAVQVFGGSGFLQDYPVEQYLRDTKITSLYEGTNGIQALDLVGRKMRQKGGVLFMTFVQLISEFINENRENDNLSDILERLEEAQGALGKVAFWFQKTAKQDIELAIQQATPFLELFGDVFVGYLLAQQAVIAEQALVEKFDTTYPARNDRKHNNELNYYASKIDTSRFFSEEVLSHAAGKANGMTRGSRSAIDMVF